MGQSSSGAKQMAPDVAVSAFALSAREEEIIAWVAKGRTNAEISRILVISPFTVKNHVQRVIKKLGASNRTEAAVRHLQGDRRRVRRESAGRDTVRLAEPVASRA